MLVLESQPGPKPCRRELSTAQQLIKYFYKAGRHNATRAEGLQGDLVEMKAVIALKPQGSSEETLGAD